MNILLTSAGRRSYLVSYFKEAVKEDKGEVHVSNSTSLCSAFQFADYTFVSPNIYDDSYIIEILNYCVKHKITLIIPLFDIDLLVLSKHKKEFASKGITILVSNTDVITKCNDKYLTYQFLKTNGFKTPKTYLSVDKVLDEISKKQLSFPLILKPRWGMGSIGVYQADTEEELLFFYNYIQKQISKSYLQYESQFTPGEVVLIQEKILGDEYGLDIINNLDGVYVNTYVKQKIAMRSGETDISKIVENTTLKALGETLAQKLQHIGNLDVDVLSDGIDYKVLEMNARFGGGYPFTHLSGVNLPKAIVEWIKGEPYDFKDNKQSEAIMYKHLELCYGK